MRRLSACVRAAGLALVLILPACASRGASVAPPSLVPGHPSAPAAPPPSVASVAIESWDAQLSVALDALAIWPSSAAYLRVGNEYRRLHVLDRAYDYFTQAINADPDDAAAFDARARVWRDWGFPESGLDDAFQAATRAPQSAAVANTVGTLLEGARYVDQAREWYERAIALDPSAGYALNNRCYLSIMQRDADAVSLCARAVAAAPDSQAVRNNLALAYAAADRIDDARREFASSGNADAAYNMGILYLGNGELSAARASFHNAFRLDPQMVAAAERARQVENLAQKARPTGGAQWP